MPNTLGGPLLVAVILLAGAYLLGRKFGRSRYTMPVAVLVIVALGFLYWDAIGNQEAWSRANATGEKSLSVTYAGGSCEDQRSVDVTETDETVKIAITTRSFARGCDSMANPRRVAVRLDRALGNRALLDGSCKPACARPGPAN